MAEDTRTATFGAGRRPASRRRPRSYGALLGAGLLLAGLAVAVPGVGIAAAATTLTVDSTDDRPDANPGDGTCRTAAGTCSLRAAIDEANALAGPDTIRFGLRGNRVHTIDIGSTLHLSDRSGGTTIDGYTQAGSAPNTNRNQSNAEIRVEITTDDVTVPMILITSAGNTLRGLSIYGNGPRIELRGEDADGNRLLGNFIGFSADATASSGVPTDAPLEVRVNDAGIVMNLGPDRNVIGTMDRADRNVIAGNGRYGVRVNHGETSQNIFENNIVGLGPTMQPVGGQTIGIDLQWWTWGNLITENTISGNRNQGIDLSHSATNNAVISNRIGTFPGGNQGNEDTANRLGITFKDNPVGNYVADNVIANNNGEGIYHRHNYTGANTVVNNRIGVGSKGRALGNRGNGITLRGHDDLYVGNIIANNRRAVFVSDSTPSPGPHTNFPAEQTLGNRFHGNTFYGNTEGPDIDIENAGPNPNDRRDRDGGAHDGLNHPEIGGIGPGEVYGTACGRCEVEVYVSGTVAGNGTLDTGSGRRGTGAGWIGRAKADNRGRWSLAHPHIVAGKDLTTVAIDPAGNTSETAPSRRVPGSLQGSGSNAATSIGAVSAPAAPPRPPAWSGPATFRCSWNAGVLSWSDDGAAEYYVRRVAADGTETYVGARTGTETSIAEAASYRVVSWARGFARSATCDGPGDPVGFTCSVAGGTLRWTD
ncbi:MAG: right-handed parallel beta-helix repeat-containing protein, partial [Actinomycetota bacterium]